MTCQSGEGTIPDSSQTHWVLFCEGSQHNTDLRLEVQYFNPLSIWEISLSTSPIDTQPGDAAWIEAVASAVVNLPYAGNHYPADPVGWIRANLHRAECFGTFSCSLDDGTVQIVLQLGYPGWVTVRLDPSPQQYR